MEPITVKLKAPISRGENSEAVQELIFSREPKVGDLKGIRLDNIRTDDLIMVAGRLCNQPPSVMDKLSLADAINVVEVIMPFLDPFQEIMKK